MVKGMPMSLQYNSKVEKALFNLRSMGLKVHLQPEGTEQVYIFITLESLMNLIKRRIPYPQKRVYIEEPFLVIYLWRG